MRPRRIGEYKLGKKIISPVAGVAAAIAVFTACGGDEQSVSTVNSDQESIAPRGDADTTIVAEVGGSEELANDIDSWLVTPEADNDVVEEDAEKNLAGATIDDPEAATAVPINPDAEDGTFAPAVTVDKDGEVSILYSGVGDTEVEGDSAGNESESEGDPEEEGIDDRVSFHEAFKKLDINDPSIVDNEIFDSLIDSEREHLRSMLQHSADNMPEEIKELMNSVGALYVNIEDFDVYHVNPECFNLENEDITGWGGFTYYLSLDGEPLVACSTGSNNILSFDELVKQIEDEQDINSGKGALCKNGLFEDRIFPIVRKTLDGEYRVFMGACLHSIDDPLQIGLGSPFRVTS